MQGVLLDLGLSSDQLAWQGRGFSFSNDGPLDMRFDPGEPGPSAADLVNQMREADLAQLFFELGEERFSRRIARRIVEARKREPIQTTGQLADLVRRIVPGRARHGPIDPATRVFQALRIAVNDELGQLDAALEAIPDLLAPGGRAAIISFHSLEDRRVKWAFKADRRLVVLTKKPVTATAQEVAVNPRARSAQTEGGGAMPEPVVIIGPASRPAGPIAEPVEDVALATADDQGVQPQNAPENNRGKIFSVLFSTLFQMAARLFGLLASASLVIAKWGMRVADRYPRHSLAVAASLVILGAISYTQMSPGAGTRGPVTTQIKGDALSGASKDAKPPEGPKNVSPQTGSGEPATAKNESAEVPKPADTAAAPRDASLTAASSPPAPNNDAGPPLPPLAAAQPDAKETEPAPAKQSAPVEQAASNAEPAPSPVSAPSQSTPTLLAGSLPEPAPTPVPPAAHDDKGSGDALKPAPAVDAPAPIAVLPTPNAQGDPPPLPAPVSDPVELANKPESAGDPSKLSPTAITTNPDSKPKDTPAPAETKTAAKPEDAPGSVPTHELSPPVSQPESMEIVSKQTEPPKSEKVVETVPVSVGPAVTPEVPATPTTPETPPPSGSQTVMAAPPVEGSPARPVTSGAAVQNDTAQPAMSAPLPVTATAVAAAAVFEGPNSNSSSTPAHPRGPDAAHGLTSSKAPAKEDLASAGWVSVPNSGKLPVEGLPDADRSATSTGVAGEGSIPTTRDVRAHAAKDARFEFESSRSRGTPELAQDGGRAAVGAGVMSEARSGSTTGRVDSVPHVVERNENFWTISRLYYSSGRYYRALWKANSDTHPDIKRLKINDVIIIPPVEELDPALIDPPKTRAPAELGGSDREPSALDRGRSSDDPTAIAKPPVSSSVARRDAADAVPVRRSSATDPDLELPPPDSVVRRPAGRERNGRRADQPLGEGEETREEPASRTAARRAATGDTGGRRPVYKIRPYDTLRSIARDMLGDSHRSSEILDLNRDLIDDPSHLIIGQVLELPDDARTSVRRSASR